MTMSLRSALCVLAVLLAAAAAPASSPCPGPAAAGPETLLPAESTVTVAVASLEELDAAWARLAAALHLEEPADLQAMVAEHAPAFAEVLDPARAMAMAFRIHPVMLQREPDWTHILPVRGDVADPSALFDAGDVAGWTLRDGYLAVSSLAEPGTVAEAPAWWHDMLPGVIAAHADLATLLDENRGVVEMGLASAPMMAEQARQQAEAEGAEAPPADMPSAEQMEGIANLARLIMDSLTAMDAAADVTADAVVLRTRFDVRPGSPLATGPQPDFADALDLTRRLPRHADLVAVGAFDQSRAVAELEDFTRASLRESYAELIRDEEALERWLDAYMELMDLANRPWAASVSGTDEGFAMRWVQRCEDADAAAAAVLELMELTRDMGLASLEALPDERAAGAAVHVRRLAYAMPPEAYGSGESGPSEREIAQVEAILDVFAGEIRVAVRDDLLLVSMNEDADAMAGMLRGGGRPHDRIASLARDAGPDVRQILAGDYGPILSLMTAVVGLETAVGPVPFTAAVTAAGPRGTLDLAVGLEGLANLAGFIEAMEAAETAQ